jgi:hypothetical protein
MLRDMGDLRRSLLVIAMASAGWMLGAVDVQACVCVGSPQPPSAEQVTRELRSDLDAALAVFAGEPIATNSLAVRFRVDSVWKGDLGREVVMSTGAEATRDGLLKTSSCDVSFRLG